VVLCEWSLRILICDIVFHPPDSSVTTGRGPKQWCYGDAPNTVYLSNLDTEDSNRNLRSLISRFAAASFRLLAIASLLSFLFTSFSWLI